MRGGGGEVFGEAAFDRVAGEGFAGAGGEQWIGGQAAAFAHPDLEHGDGLAGERRDPFFPALPERSQVRSGAELDVGVGERDQLGDPEPGLGGAEQQGVVTAAGWGGSVGALKQRFDGATDVSVGGVSG